MVEHNRLITLFKQKFETYLTETLCLLGRAMATQGIVVVECNGMLVGIENHPKSQAKESGIYCELDIRLHRTNKTFRYQSC